MPGEHLTTAEALALLGISRSRLARLRRQGVFKLGVHFSRPKGMHIRWKRGALEQHLAGEQQAETRRPPIRSSRSRSRLNQSLLRR